MLWIINILNRVNRQLGLVWGWCLSIQLDASWINLLSLSCPGYAAWGCYHPNRARSSHCRHTGSLAVERVLLFDPNVSVALLRSNRAGRLWCKVAGWQGWPRTADPAACLYSPGDSQARRSDDGPGRAAA